MTKTNYPKKPNGSELLKPEKKVYKAGKIFFFCLYEEWKINNFIR